VARDSGALALAGCAIQTSGDLGSTGCDGIIAITSSPSPACLTPAELLSLS